MTIRSAFVGIFVLVCACILGADNGTPAQGARSRTAAPASPRAADNNCLACHAPFDKLIETSGKKYVAPSGEKTSPHRYVPHNSKKEEDIPECSHCHTAHPVDPPPAPGSIDLSKVGVQWCYDACHHEKNLQSCKECHP